MNRNRWIAALLVGAALVAIVVALAIPRLRHRSALARAESALTAGDLPRAASEAEKVLALDPNDARAAVISALALARQRPLPPAANAAAQRALLRAPTLADAHYAHALVLDGEDKPAEGLVAITRAIALGAGLDARLLESSLAMRTGDDVRARAAIAAVLAIDPNDARALYNLGVVEQKAGHFNGAREAYLKALARDKRSYGARYNLALLTFDAGAKDEARHHVQSLLREYPGDAPALELLKRIDPAQ